MSPARSERTTWLVSLGITVLALGGTAWLLLSPRDSGADAPPAAPAPAFGGRGPDISGLTTRQAFDRLFDRVLTAGEQGDTATAVRFTEHALAAYQQLDSVDADARYHAAVLHAQVGGYPAARALGDSILAGEPDHLLGWLVRGMVADLERDSTALRQARDGFLAAWARDPGTGRPEYQDHRQALDRFHTTATRATP
jgi:hypothetical protein